MIPQVLLSLDYELFFGIKTGSVENCLIRPTGEIAEIARRHNSYLSLFVDAIYLQRLAAEALRVPQLQRDFDAIRQQLVSLREQGHDIQLHLHPHWLDSSFDGDHWRLDTSRYKLHDFSVSEIAAIVGSAKEILTNLVGDTVFAFRAGGWCLQPFSHIAEALLAHGIWLESTVFAGGVSDDKERWFDFSSAPVKDFWRFSNDPNSEDSLGPFVEVPINAIRLNPLMFWRMALLRKILSSSEHKAFGDGVSMAWGRGYYLQRLTRSTISVVSVDGLKAGLLEKAFRDQQNNTDNHLFHVMGHPKALSCYSLGQLDNFLAGLGSYASVTFQDFRHLQPGTVIYSNSAMENKETA